MKIDPALRALRDDSAPQRHAQARMQRARDELAATPEWSKIATELARYGAGAALSDCPALARLFREQGAARDFGDGVVGRFIGELAAGPFGHIPFRHSSDSSKSTLLLGRSGQPMLMLVAQEPGQFAPQSVTFSHGERYDAVLAGRAEMRVIRKLSIAGGKATLVSERMGLRQGSLFSLALEEEATVIDRVDSRLVSLRLRRAAPEPVPMQQYRLDDGGFLRQAAGDPGESRIELMMALLGRMGRKDAFARLQEFARSGSDHLRWQAIREGLALDTERGFLLLNEIADNSADSLAAPASDLIAHLLSAYPELNELRDTSCPA